MSETIWTTTPSPVGELLLTGDGHTLHALRLADADAPGVVANGHRRDDRAFAEARAQLHQYFGGTRTTFQLSVAPRGTPFQLRVWEALRHIPYGTTASYGEVAAAVGRPSASRAVGLANGRNPIAIIVPCHRVIGADGRLVGYGGGLDRKRYLLEHEASAPGRHVHGDQRLDAGRGP